MKFLLTLIFSTTAFAVQSQNNPVIVELFTSQGCSSCPAADKNLTDLLQHYNQQGKPVFGLSFHVDYWNNLGWKDPYSSKEFTKRQRQYASILNLNSIYTPQMIVNGRNEFVGSNKSAAIKAIDAQLKMENNYGLSINTIKLEGNIITVGYALSKVPEATQLQIAIVEKSLENEVPAGENSGRKLQHNNVVRTFKSVAPSLRGAITLEQLKTSSKKLMVILYLQDAEMNIVAADSKPI